MKLHENKELFKESILNISRELKIAPAVIEKDYYVTIILNELNKRIPGLLFKGGTCLSKCYKLIDRFSEDIDLTLDNEHYSQSKKRNANKTIIEVCDELEFKLLNREFLENHGHANYNAYHIEYPNLFETVAIKPYVKIEMVFIQKAYPDIIGKVDSYIGLWLLNNGYNEYIKKYELEPFEMRVLSLERTFVDKVFAICDYYLKKEDLRNSRHIYDISKLITRMNLYNIELKTLVHNVRIDRSNNKTCLSAKENIIIPKVLNEIISSNFYKKDYEDTTSKLLTKPLSYDEAIVSLKTIIESKLFDE